MGNSNEMTSAMAQSGKNIKAYFEGGYFSLAFGDEIALCLNDSEEFYILNCTPDLFTEVKQEIESGKSKEDLISFWVEKSKDYEISDWSDDFNNLKRRDYLC